MFSGEAVDEGLRPHGRLAVEWRITVPSTGRRMWILTVPMVDKMTASLEQTRLRRTQVLASSAARIPTAGEHEEREWLLALDRRGHIRNRILPGLRHLDTRLDPRMILE